MKTADLIPFILLELDLGDKYGFELTKDIETKSNGKIVIKQPTLYTLLKKLEKSKFITSYWQDSEIGGKRHYYKLTENGKLQVSTLPSYSFLLQKAMNEETEGIEQSEKIEEVATVSPSKQSEEKRFSIMDELLNVKKEPKETILPTNEVFAENKIDSSTELGANISNTEILKDEKSNEEHQFATSKEVAKFTEKVVNSNPNVANVSKVNNADKFLDVEFVAPKNEMEVKFVNYINFKNTDNYKYSKSLSLNMLYRTLATSGSLILMLILCGIITKFAGGSTLYYIFFISALTVAVFNPIVYLLNMEKFRLKYQKTTYYTNLKKHLLIAIVIVLAIFMLCIIVNISINNNSISKIFGITNFANLYAPLLLTCVLFLDLLYHHLFISKLQK